MSSSATTQPVRILVADEHPILRDGLRWLLEARPGHAIVGESAGGPAVVALVRGLEPDILLLRAAEIDDPALDTLEQIAALGLSVRTIVLTPSLRHERVVEAVRRGARGVISTQTAADVLFETIDFVIKGGIWIGMRPAPGPDVPANPREVAKACLPPNAFGLTPREIEILRAVVNGETNKRIANRCSISENTVKRHVMHLFDKVGASNRVELALFAQHHELTQGV
jgi:two-component system nitrate/nitrite response regulator NarL